MDFLFILNKNNEKNIFVNYIIEHFSSSYLYYTVDSELNNLSSEKLIQFIHNTQIKNIILDNYDMYMALEEHVKCQVYYLDLLNNKVDLIRENKFNLIVFDKYKKDVYLKFYPWMEESILCLEEFKSDYPKINKSILYIFNTNKELEDFFDKYTPEIQKKIFEYIKSFFENSKKFSFDYALKILLELSVDIKNNIHHVYNSLYEMYEMLNSIETLKEKDFNITFHAENIEFLPNAYSSANSMNLDELLYINKIVILPRYSLCQSNDLIEKICYCLFNGCGVLIHETNNMLVEHYAFKNIALYKTIDQIPKLLGAFKYDVENIEASKNFVMSFENNTKKLLDEKLKILKASKSKTIEHLKMCSFKDKVTLLYISNEDRTISKNIEIKTKKISSLEDKNTLVSWAKMDNQKSINNIIINNNADKVCVFDRSIVDIEDFSILDEIEIYVYSNDVKSFNIEVPQKKNECFITSSISLFEYFKKENYKCILDVSLEDDNQISICPTKELATYVFLYDNEKDCQGFFNDENISENSKKHFSKYIDSLIYNNTLLSDDMVNNHDTRTFFKEDKNRYINFIQKIIINHINTKLLLIGRKIDIDIYGNNVLLYSIMDNVQAFCKYQRDFTSKVDFFNTVAEYKFFVYPSYIKNDDFSFLISLISTIKNTCIIIPKKYKPFFVMIGMDADVFYFYSDKNDVSEIYTLLNNEEKRNNAISLYMNQLDNKVNCILS